MTWFALRKFGSNRLQASLIRIKTFFPNSLHAGSTWMSNSQCNINITQLCWIIPLSAAIFMSKFCLYLEGSTIAQQPRVQQVTLCVLSWFPCSLSFWEFFSNVNNAITSTLCIVYCSFFLWILLYIDGSTCN